MSQISAHLGDTPTENIQNPFDLHLTRKFRTWIHEESISFALTTYAGSKLIMIGPGLDGGTVVTERDFERCMALHVDGPEALWISGSYTIWKLENALSSGRPLDGWDALYLPRHSHVTGNVDLHDLHRTSDGTLYGVITAYNCVATIGKERGSFSPFWKPPFISHIANGDRCHLNGFCFDGDQLAYVSIVGPSDAVDGWRHHRAHGGIIMDARTHDILAEGLSMPHTPRLYEGRLWFLEAGAGWICTLDPQTRKIERVLWRPGFLRGLRFYKHYALICSSEPRNKVFEGLPLQDELDRRGIEAQCALEIIDTRTMEVIHTVRITGAVKELYDVAPLYCRQPRLHGLQGDDIRKTIVLGPDHTRSL